MIIVFPVFQIAGNDACPRPGEGSIVADPPELHSVNGVLETALTFRTSRDPYDQARYCYLAAGGMQSPTLRVNPGDEVILHFRNEAGAASAPAHAMAGGCTPIAATATATNLHFHGLSIPPVCHQDDVLRTLVAPGAGEYEYRFRIPADQTPGLYWYHPHPHGFTEEQVLGGASGALIVNGIERFHPETAGAFERVIVLRDQLPPGQQLNYMEPGEESDKDLSINLVPVTAPMFRPAVLEARAGRREFWRVLNASADTYFDLQLMFGGKEQRLPVVAFDGAPVQPARARKSVLIVPGGRAEFLVTIPGPGIDAKLISRNYDTGPWGAKNPERTIALLITRGADESIRQNAVRLPVRQAEDLRGLAPAHQRRLFLSEERPDLTDPTSVATYYITEEGAVPHAFDMMSDRPEITVRQGTLEDWTVENRAREAHTFHIHQLHFQVLERDGRKVEPVTMDTIDLPYWDGKGPYPSVKLRMDFRSPAIVGTFVYHCHILEHEDNGMMGRIRVTRDGDAK